MISSMTGFGQASCQIDGVAYAVEIKTVNNRYFKAILRVSDIASFTNDVIEKTLRNKIHRGTVNYSLRMQAIGEVSLFDINENVISEAAGKLKTVASKNGIDGKIDLAQLLSLPGAVCPISPDAEQSEKMKNVILELTGEAIEKLKQMRSDEGKALADDMLSNCEVISQRLDTISEGCSKMIELYHDKLKKRTDDLLSKNGVNIDADTLAREVAIYAERSDIAEELSRLRSHLKQFAICCEKNDKSGRRLDFMSQEMLREANTIASKALNVEISQSVIDIKCAIDRIKEQVQNVE